MAKRRRGVAVGFHGRLRRHLKADPAECVVVEQSFAMYQRANIHLALEKLLGAVGTKWELNGIIIHQHYETVSLNKLSRAESAAWYMSGPVEYEDVAVADGGTLACVKRGCTGSRASPGRWRCCSRTCLITRRASRSA